MDRLLPCALIAVLLVVAGCASDKQVSPGPKDSPAALQPKPTTPEAPTVKAPEALSLTPTRDARVFFHSSEAALNGGRGGRLRTRGIQASSGEVILMDFDRAAIKTFLEGHKDKTVTATLVLHVYEVQRGPGKVEVASLDSAADWVEGTKSQDKADKGESCFNAAQLGVKPWTTAAGKEVKNIRELLYDKKADRIKTLLNANSVEVSSDEKTVEIELDAKFLTHMATDENCRGLVLFNRHPSAKVDFYSRDQSRRSPVLALAAGPAVVIDPYVLTDKSVDCRTVDGIVKSLVKDGMTDEQKVLAVFHWIRRLIYHGDGPLRYAYNFHNMIHVQGHGSCLRQTTPMWVLLDRLGYKCRTGAVSGHHIIEVRYGGQWHLLDPHMNFYVYDRATPPAIASIEQIKADTTLVSDAVKEGRACPGFLLCGDSVSTFATRKGWRILGDFPESRKYTPVIKEPFGRITLRRGETYVRTWMPGEHWFQANWPRKNEGPRHGCGRRDKKDTVNWPIYEPHAAGTRYRHWGAGYLLYKPDLATDHYADGVVGKKNVTSGAIGAAGGLVSGRAGGPGEVIFSVNCPYVITAGELRVARLGRGDLAASVSIDSGKTWKPVELKMDANSVNATFVKEVNGSFQGYWLKIVIPVEAGIAGLELKSHFQLNPYSLPYLVPGKNVVSVVAAGYGSPLTVTWNWSEGPEWKTPKSVSKTFTANGSFQVETQGPKYPRMRSLTLGVAP